MWKRKFLLAALTAASLGGTAFPAAAAVYVDVAPPPLRHEVVPAARTGYVWQPGYWEHRHGRYVWHKGMFVKERRGMYWHPHRWEEVNGRWVFHQGGWNRERFVLRDAGHPHGDRDRDGIPNRVDRDRDGDGVPNRFDRAPDNPRRQ